MKLPSLCLLCNCLRVHLVLFFLFKYLLNAGNFGVINVSHSEPFDSKKAACVAGVQTDGGRG